MKASRKILSAAVAICALSGVVSSADAHVFHTGSKFSSHYFHSAHWSTYRHWGYHRYHTWHRWHYPRYGVGVYASAPDTCPVGYHRGYLGRHCWPNRT